MKQDFSLQNFNNANCLHRLEPCHVPVIAREDWFYVLPVIAREDWFYVLPVIAREDWFYVLPVIAREDWYYVFQPSPLRS